MRFPLRAVGALLAVSLIAGCGGKVATSATPPTGTRAGSPIACSPTQLKPSLSGAMTWSATLDGVSAQLETTIVHRQFMQFLDQPMLTLRTASGARWQTPVRAAPDAFGRPKVLSQGVALATQRRPSYLCLVRFDRNATPLAVLTVYAGGMHCCTTFRVYDPATKTETALATGNMGGQLEVVDGAPLIRTDDDRFFYAFTAFAFSGAPIRLVRPTGTGFADITRDHPDLVRADASRWWQLVEKGRSALETVGVLAAWAADEELLGQDATVWRKVDALNRAGSLGRTSYDPEWPLGDGYVAKLRQFLRDNGYIGV